MVGLQLSFQNKETGGSVCLTDAGKDFVEIDLHLSEAQVTFGNMLTLFAGWRLFWSVK